MKSFNNGSSVLSKFKFYLWVNWFWIISCLVFPNGDWPNNLKLNERMFTNEIIQYLLNRY